MDQKNNNSNRDFLESYFQEDFKKLKDEHSRLLLEVTTYKRLATMVFFFLTLIGIILAFFGWDRFEAIEKTILSQVNANVVPRLQLVDSLSRKISTEQLDSVASLIQKKESNASAQLEALDNLLTAISNRERQTTILVQKSEETFSEIERRSASLERNLSTVKERVDRQLRETQEVGTSVQQLRTAQESALRDILNEVTPNEEIFDSELEFQVPKGYASIDEHSLFDVIAPLKPVKAASELNVWVRLNSDGLKVGKYWFVSISHAGKEGEGINWWYWKLKEDINRLVCTQLKKGKYRVQICLATVRPDRSPLYYLRHHYVTLH